MSFSVIVLCPNGRRETVKITPNNSILQVLEEACKKQSLNPEDFDLYHFKKSLDLSLPLRFANLPNNALLELHPAKISRKECQVSIALQLESGERFMGNFKPSSTIHDILMQFLEPDALTLYGKREPVCVYMRQQIAGEALKTTTLRSLGLTKGSAIIRLMYRELEQLDSQAHVSSPLSFRPVSEQVPSMVTNKSSKTLQSSVNKSDATSLPHDEFKANSAPSEMQEKVCDTAINNNKRINEEMTTSPKKNNDSCTTKKFNIGFCQKDSSPSDDPSQHSKSEWSSSENATCVTETAEDMDCDLIKEDDIEIGDINYIGNRHAVLYSLDDITAVKKADLPDEFFELTVKDVRYLMEEFKRERQLMENHPLLTKEQRERQLCQKFSGYSQTVIRIYFPEKLVLQAVFRITETVQSVCEFLKDYLEKKDISFYLYTTPPKEKLVSSKTLLECLLVPAAVVHFGSDVQLPYYLNTSLRQKKSDPRAAALAAAQSRIENASNMEMDISSSSTNISVSSESSLATTSTLNGANSNAAPSKPQAVPKWLKLSKK